MFSIAGGLTGSILNIFTTIQGEQEWWVYLITSIAPTLLGFLLDIVVGILKKKGIIDSSTTKRLEDKIDDISNKEKKDE